MRCGGMLRTPNDIIEALRARKAELQLSDALVDEIAGLTSGHWGKITARERSPTVYTLMSIVGALGLAVTLVPDPDATVARRWEKRREHLTTAGSARPPCAKPARSSWPQRPGMPSARGGRGRRRSSARRYRPHCTRPR